MMAENEQKQPNEALKQQKQSNEALKQQEQSKEAVREQGSQYSSMMQWIVLVLILIATGYVIYSQVLQMQGTLEKQLTEAKTEVVTCRAEKEELLKELLHRDKFEALANKDDFDDVIKKCEGLKSDEGALIWNEMYHDCKEKKSTLESRIADLVRDYTQCKVLINQVSEHIASQPESAKDSSYFETLAKMVNDFMA